MEIITRAEAKALGLSHYFTGKPCKHGHIEKRHVSSKTCMRCIAGRTRKWREANPDRVKEYIQKWHEANPDKKIERLRKWKEANPEKVKEQKRRYREKNSDRVKEALRKWREENTDKHRQLCSKWAKENADKMRSLNAKRRAAKLSAIHPDWRKDEDEKRSIEEIYAEAKDISNKTGITHHVDHIVALRGIDESGNPVRGPHVWWNLRVIPGAENISKLNKVTNQDIELMLENFRNSIAGSKYIASVRAQLGATPPKDWILPDYFS